MIPGVFELEVEGEGEDFLRSLPGRVDRMVRDLVNDVADHAGEQLRFHAPGGIPGLVHVDEAQVLQPGAIEATAGVEPDITADTFGRGQISDPADYPVFVEVGTGVFGPAHREIAPPPPTVMAIPPGRGYSRTTFTRSIKGQKPQRYAEHSHEETVAWVPTRIARMRLPSGGT